MAQTGAAKIRPLLHPRLCVMVAAMMSLAILSVLAMSESASAQPIKGDASFSASQGFARLILKLDEDVESEVVTAGSILVIRFNKQVDIPVDKLSDAVPDYVGSARRDPDGMAIRLALSRKITVNTMTAGERIFIDMLPDGWKGQPPSLPQEVVRELAERARVAERQLRQQKNMTEAKKRPPVRVRGSVQPTFVRFIFELPENVAISSSLEDKKLSLVFSAPLSFDLSDAVLIAPSSISGIEQKTDGESATVTFATLGEVDVHSFREDANYVVDIGFDKASGPSPLSAPVSDAKSTPVSPATMPSKPTGAAAMGKQGAMVPAPAEPTMHPPKPAMVAAQQPVAEPGVAASDKNSSDRTVPDRATPANAIVDVSKDMSAKPPVPEANLQAAAASVESAPKAAESKPVESMTADSKPMESAPASLPRGDTITVLAKRGSDGLRLIFPFKEAKPVAMFRRGDAVWLITDDDIAVNTDAIGREGGSIVGDVTTQKLEKGQAIRFRLSRPQLVSFSGDGAVLTVTFADAMETSPLPLAVNRNVLDPARAHVAVALPGSGMIHKLADPEAGDGLIVVTALLPTQGLIRRQDFVEFSLLESIHGVVVQPYADDVMVGVSTDSVVISRSSGLTLSSADIAPQRSTSGSKPMFDITEWRENRDAVFTKRLDALVQAAGQANGDKKVAANIDLARFYLARGFYPEAKGAVELVLADAKPGTEDPSALILHGIASILSGQPAIGLKDFSSNVIGTGYDLQAWKGLAYAWQEKWPEAREKFKNAEFSIAALPDDMQRVLLSAAMRASLKVRDYGGAAARSNDLDVVGLLPAIKPSIAVMRGQLSEAMGREKDALLEYRDVMTSADEKSASQATLLEIALRQKRNEISADDALRGLETLAIMWRGDSTELDTLLQLSRIYASSRQYGASLAAARVATRLSPNSDTSRLVQDETSALFSELFLGPKGDELPPIEALGLFYEYRELTPIGRRGDEMIRRLVERLVSVDLLDQAADLLQYQIDHRLEGAARAQVATRLATIYLMNRKPDRAVGVIRATRIADLAGELRQQRLLLEARAQSDIGRHDLALDIISNLTGREVVRLRSDIHWAARHWRDSAEQIELYYGERWKDFRPLNTMEKGDVIRAAIGYALADDAIGLSRFREKYGPKMSDPADRTAFDVASKPVAASSAEFAQIAKMAGAVDTLDGFLREMKNRFPEMTAKATPPAGTAASDPNSTGALPAIARLDRDSR
jgi:hypothetical protein